METNTTTIENPPSKIQNPPTPYLHKSLHDILDTDALTADQLDRLSQLPLHSSLITQHSSLLSSYLPPNQLTLLISNPSTGKSLLALHLAAALSRNEGPFQPTPNPNPCPSPAPALDLNPPPLSNSQTPKLPNSPSPLSNSQTPQFSNSSPETLLLSEDHHSLLLPRLKALRADLSKIHLFPHVHSLVSLFKPTKSNPDPFRPLQLLQSYLDDHPNIRLIILDPLLKFLNHYAKRTDLTGNLLPSTLLEKLQAIAADRHITILATATFPQLKLSAITDSLAKNFLTNTIKNILLLTPDPRPPLNPHLHPHLYHHQIPSPSSESLPNSLTPKLPNSSSPLLLMHLKSPTAPAPTLPLTLINGIPTFHPAPLNPGVTPPGYNRLSPASSASPNREEPCSCETPDPYTAWYSQSLSLTPSSLPALRRASRPPSPAVASAMAFLHTFLHDHGPTPFKTILKNARPNCIPEITLRRAARRLQVVHAPNLFIPQWLWHLPNDLRPFPGDPKANPAAQLQDLDRRKAAFQKQQAEKAAQYAAQRAQQFAAAHPPQERKSPDLPSSRPQPKAPSTIDHLQQNQPSQPTPTAKPTPQTPQPPRPPIPLGPIT